MFTIRLCKHNLMQKSTLLQQTRLQPTLPYRKIPKISPGADIFEGPFFRGLSYGRKFAFQNRLG